MNKNKATEKNSYTIVTTPMCEKILKFANIKQYKVNKNPDKEEGDLAILLSESKIKMPSIKIKLNTFSQIKDSIIQVSKEVLKIEELSIEKSKYDHSSKISEEEIIKTFENYKTAKEWINKGKKEKKRKLNSKIKVKVYSLFLKDIVEDMGFRIDNESYNYIVYPDYMKFPENINPKEKEKYIKIPTHKNVPKDPIKRAELRYSILSQLVNKL